MKAVKQNTIYWAVENREDGFYLHAFAATETRQSWLWETMGLSVHSVGGRGFVTELKAKDDPFQNENNHPIIWH